MSGTVDDMLMIPDVCVSDHVQYTADAKFMCAEERYVSPVTWQGQLLGDELLPLHLPTQSGRGGTGVTRGETGARAAAC